MESSPHGKVRLMTSTEPDLLQERLNTFLSELEVSAAVVSIQYSSSTHGTGVLYSAFVYYKLLDTTEW
jgi:hypothetical protein